MRTACRLLIAYPMLAVMAAGQGFTQHLFEPAVPLPDVDTFSEFAAGDVDEDGLTDLVLRNNTSPGPFIVSLYLGLGGGAFGPAQPLDFPDGGIFGDFSPVFARDLDGDGHLDVVNPVSGAGKVGVRLGHGDGTFGPLLTSPGAAGSPVDADVSDADGDGLLDLLLVESGTSTQPDHGTIKLMRGEGDGTFQPSVVIHHARSPDSVEVADFDGDGTPDLAYLDNVAPFQSQAFVIVARGLGGGVFADGVGYPSPDSGVNLVAADIDRNGTVDLLQGNAGNPGWLLLSGNGRGDFFSALEFGPAGEQYVAVADLDRDGYLDIVARSHTTLFAQRMVAGEITGAAVSVPFGASNGFFGLVIADLDVDGLPDVAVHVLTTTLFLDALGPWIDIGQSKPTVSGAPALAGSGTPAAGQTVTLQISGLAAGLPGQLFLGSSPAQLSLKGGHLVPSPEVLLLVNVGTPLSGPWPAGVPVGTALYLQAWFEPAPDEIAASNALVVIAE
jgi:hypothetical protein